MTETRNRFYKARRRAKIILISCGYHVEFISNGIFDIDAWDESGHKKIKICLDAVAEDDGKVVSKSSVPMFCGKEIWLKKPGLPNFEIIKIKTFVNRKSLPV